MSSMILHCNAVAATYDDLTKVVLPEQHEKFKDKCAKYGTVPHHKLVDAVRAMSAHTFGPNAITAESFGLSQGEAYPGARFFALFKFDIDGSGVEQKIQNMAEVVAEELTDEEEIAKIAMLGDIMSIEEAANAPILSVNEVQASNIIVDDRIFPAFAMRNSHDRSMGISAALGHNCFICDNLSLSGDVMFARKHTINALQDVLLTFWSLIQTMKEQYVFDQEFRDAAKKVEVKNDFGFEILGRMAGNGALSFEGGNKSQFALAMNQWKKPTYEVFEDRTLWSLHNAVTYAQRKSGIGRRLEAGSTGSAITRDILDNIEGGTRWIDRAEEITGKYRNPTRATILDMLDLISTLPATAEMAKG